MSNDDVTALSGDVPLNDHSKESEPLLARLTRKRFGDPGRIAERKPDDERPRRFDPLYAAVRQAAVVA